MLTNSARIICGRLEYTAVATCLLHACQHPSKPLAVRLMSLCQPYTNIGVHMMHRNLIEMCLLGRYARLRIGVLRIGVTEHTLFVRFTRKSSD